MTITPLALRQQRTSSRIAFLVAPCIPIVASLMLATRLIDNDMPGNVFIPKMLLLLCFAALCVYVAVHFRENTERWLYWHHTKNSFNLEAYEEAFSRVRAEKLYKIAVTMNYYDLLARFVSYKITSNPSLLQGDTGMIETAYERILKEVKAEREGQYMP